MTKTIELKEADIPEDYAFNEEIQELLSRVQEMLATKEELTNDAVMVFIANLTMNLIINAEICNSCFMGLLAEIDKEATERGFTTSHDTMSEKEATCH